MAKPKFSRRLAAKRFKKSSLALPYKRYQRYKPYHAFESAAKKRYPGYNISRAMPNVWKYHAMGSRPQFRSAFNYIRAVQKTRARTFKQKRAFKQVKNIFNRWRSRVRR